jgi:hypothetical protein
MVRVLEISAVIAISLVHSVLAASIENLANIGPDPFPAGAEAGVAGPGWTGFLGIPDLFAVIGAGTSSADRFTLPPASRVSGRPGPGRFVLPLTEFERGADEGAFSTLAGGRLAALLAGGPQQGAMDQILPRVQGLDTHASGLSAVFNSLGPPYNAARAKMDAVEVVASLGPGGSEFKAIIAGGGPGYPEPLLFALLGGGLALLAFAGRRQK